MSVPYETLSKLLSSAVGFSCDLQNSKGVIAIYREVKIVLQHFLGSTLGSFPFLSKQFLKVAVLCWAYFRRILMAHLWQFVRRRINVALACVCTKVKRRQQIFSSKPFLAENRGFSNFLRAVHEYDRFSIAWVWFLGWCNIANGFTSERDPNLILKWRRVVSCCTALIMIHGILVYLSFEEAMLVRLAFFYWRFLLRLCGMCSSVH